MSLADQLTQLVAPYDGLVAGCVWQQDDCIWATRQDVRFPAASTIKLAILATLLDQQPDLDQPVAMAASPKVGGAGVLQLLHSTTMPLRDVMALMISVSDNYATNLLIKLVTMPAVNQWLTAHGFHQTQLNRLLMDGTAAAAGRENQISAADAVGILRYLLRHHPVVLPWLLNQQFRYKLPASFDETTSTIQVANKTGEGPLIDHDVARFETATGQFDVAILTKGFEHRQDALTLLSSIGAELAAELQN